MKKLILSFFVMNLSIISITISQKNHSINSEKNYLKYIDLFAYQSSELKKQASKNAEGWYFIRWEYIVSNSDGAKIGHFANGDKYTEINKATGEKNNFTTSKTRVDKNNKTIASGKAITKWSDPPKYFSANDLPAITVKRTVESSWGISQFSITFDMKDTNPGGGSYGKINFATPKGETHIQTFDGTMKAQKKAKGSKQGEQKAIILHLNGYGFKYYYEWRE
jgi:hypothetical protein